MDLPLPAERRSSLLCAIKRKAAEFDLMPLIFFKICTDCLSRLTSLSKLNLSTKWLGFDLCCKIVKFPTKPLAFCRGELIEEHLVFYFWGYFFQPQFTWPKAQENDGILLVTLHGKPALLCVSSGEPYQSAVARCHEGMSKPSPAASVRSCSVGCAYWRGRKGRRRERFTYLLPSFLL